MSAKRKYLFFALIVLLNIISKALFSNSVPFWYDEMVSVKNTLLDFGHIKHEAEWDNNPPFYYYCLWVWHQLLPISEFNTRLLSVLFISLAIGFVYLFAEKYFDAKTALFSAALLSLSNFLIVYAQEARTYSLIVLLSVLSTLQFFKYLNKTSWVNLALLSLINFLIVYSHYLACLVIIVQYLIVILYYKKSIKAVFFLQTGLILLLIWLRFTDKQFAHILSFNETKDFWLQPAHFNDLVSAFTGLFFNAFTAVVFGLLAFVFVYNYFVKKEQDPMKAELYCFLVGFASILGLFFVGVYKSVFLSRYLIFCIPFATLLVVHQLTKLKAVGISCLVILIAWQACSLRLIKPSLMDYKSVAAIIRKYKQEKDVVIINKSDNLRLFEYYYNKQDLLRYKNIDSLCNAQHIFAFNDLNSLKDLYFDKNTRLFLVQSFHKTAGNQNSFRDHLNTTAKPLYHTEFYDGVELSVFKVN